MRRRDILFTGAGLGGLVSLAGCFDSKKTISVPKDAFNSKNVVGNDGINNYFKGEAFGLSNKVYLRADMNKDYSRAVSLDLEMNAKEQFQSHDFYEIQKAISEK